LSPSPAPRHFLPSAPLPGAGLPGDRLARLAARRAFVGMKAAFLDATRALSDQRGEWLRQQVRGAEEPVDLWLLRGPLFEALKGRDPQTRLLRLQIRRELEAVFPDSSPASAFGTF